jgi:hypothetical protein
MWISLKNADVCAKISIALGDGLLPGLRQMNRALTDRAMYIRKISQNNRKKML